MAPTAGATEQPAGPAGQPAPASAPMPAPKPAAAAAVQQPAPAPRPDVTEVIRRHAAEAASILERGHDRASGQRGGDAQDDDRDRDKR